MTYTVDAALAHADYLSEKLHIRYDQRVPGRCDCEKSGWGDCSGTVCNCYRAAGNDIGCLGSFQLARNCFAAGLQIPLEEARHRKCLVFEGINEGRGGIPGVDPGHVGWSLGDNMHTWEARGHVAGVGYFLFDSLHWTGAYLPYGLSLDDHPTPAPIVKPVDIEKGLLMTTIATGQTATPAGRQATVRAVPNLNLVIGENGGRIYGDQPVPGSPCHAYIWSPHSQGAILPPGAQLYDVIDLRIAGKRVQKYDFAALYNTPNNDMLTYGGRFI